MHCAGDACYDAAGMLARATGMCKAADGAACDLDHGVSRPRCVVTGDGTVGTCTLPVAATCP